MSFEYLGRVTVEDLKEHVSDDVYVDLFLADNEDVRGILTRKQWARRPGFNQGSFNLGWNLGILASLVLIAILHILF